MVQVYVPPFEPNGRSLSLRIMDHGRTHDGSLPLREFLR